MNKSVLVECYNVLVMIMTYVHLGKHHEVFQDKQLVLPTGVRLQEKDMDLMIVRLN